MKTVGVTGAGGYIGSRVVYELKDSYNVVAVDNFYKGTIKKIGDIEVINADIRDKPTMESLFDVDVIAHLAAIPGVEACNKAKELSYDVNVKGTRIIAEICKEHSIPLIFASSFGAMGDIQYFPIDETHPRNPMHWYGQTKYHGERIVAEASLDHFPCYLLIKSNVYGVHTINGAAVFKSTVINKFTDAAKTNGTLSVYKPGSQARNFLHVKDAAFSYRLAVSHIFKASPRAESFCIATSEAVSIKEVAEQVKSIAQEYDLSPEICMVDNPRTETLVEDFSINISKAQKVLGFFPQYTIEKAVREMLERETHL
ncbi:MAG: NAD(P)-dependent oxidoreductase [Theionarchaea archaeon]|nr:NAD(P)-dependent oxidoreductase [Theionarchaea archaeon]